MPKVGLAATGPGLKAADGLALGATALGLGATALGLGATALGLRAAALGLGATGLGLNAAAGVDGEARETEDGASDAPSDEMGTDSAL